MGFDASVLCELRQRLIDHKATRRIFDAFLQRLQAKGWLSGRPTQRTDSLAVFGAIGQLNRLELVRETLRLTLEAIARVDALWLARHTPDEWCDTYGQWTQAERIVRGTGARGLAETQQRLLQTGRDGFVLLQAVDHPLTPAVIAALPAVSLLRQVWEQQYRRVEETTRKETTRKETTQEEPLFVELCDHASRCAEERRELIDNPHDSQARFATKRSQSWTGYNLHLTQTAEEEAPALITDVAVVAANSYRCCGLLLENRYSKSLINQGVWREKFQIIIATSI